MTREQNQLYLFGGGVEIGALILAVYWFGFKMAVVLFLLSWGRNCTRGPK